jgi:phage terminase large subunit-like protein
MSPAELAISRQLSPAIFADRAKALGFLRQLVDRQKETVRRIIVRGGRVDLLAELLGYVVHPVAHLSILRHQMTHRRSLTLAPRGGGKTLMGTVTKAIHLLVRNPRTKGLIVSKTEGNAEGMLRTVRSHIESGERFRWVFGDLVGKRPWNDSEILLKDLPEDVTSTITAVGIGGALPSKHFDWILADDLIELDSARSETERRKTLDWFMTVAMPTLNPPSSTDPDVGQLHVLGTRYHPDDIYSTFKNGMMKGATLEIAALARGNDPALPDEERSFWEERFSTKHLIEMRDPITGIGLVAFNSQMQQNTEAMKGKIFQYDDCNVCEEEKLPDPKKCILYVGTDLAIRQRKKDDRFALVAILVDEQKPDPHIWVVGYYSGQLRILEQKEKIVAFALAMRKKFLQPEHTKTRIGIESNGYQEGQIQLTEKEIRDNGLPLEVIPINTTRDKEVRAQRLAPIFQRGRVHFVKGLDLLVDEIVQMPDGAHDDGFDALDAAMTLGVRGTRRKVRTRKLGVIGVSR